MIRYVNQATLFNYSTHTYIKYCEHQHHNSIIPTTNIAGKNIHTHGSIQLPQHNTILILYSFRLKDTD